MKRWIFGILFVVILGVMVVGVVATYFLQTEKLVVLLQREIESRLGIPFEVGRAEKGALGTYHLHDVKMERSSPGTQALASLRVKDATARFDILGTLATRGTLLDLGLKEVNLLVQRDPQAGWVQFFPEPNGSAIPDQPTSEEILRSFRLKSNRLRLSMDNLQMQIVNARWGHGFFRSEQPWMLQVNRLKEPEGYRIESDAELRYQIKMDPTWFLAQGTLVRNLVQTFGVEEGVFSIHSLFSMWKQRFEISSHGNEAALHIQSESGEVEVQRFHAFGTTVDGTPSVMESVNLEGVRIRHRDWDNPLVENLRIPWYAPPDGPVDLECRQIRWKPGNLMVQLAFSEVPEVTLSTQDFPWLRVFSNKALWKINHLAMEMGLTLDSQARKLEWKDTHIQFESGKSGTLDSSGIYNFGVPPTWEVFVHLKDYILPELEMGGKAFQAGVFEGTMQWGETGSEGEHGQYVGKGSIRLHDGQIGGVHLLWLFQNILDLHEIADKPFQTFTFDFNWTSARLEISNLLLESPLLTLAGIGSYGQGDQVDFRMKVHPSRELADSLKSPRTVTIFRAAAESEPIEIQITGNIENPKYRFIPGAGFQFPMDSLDLGF